jgi:hypothetical protein
MRSQTNEPVDEPGWPSKVKSNGVVVFDAMTASPSFVHDGVAGLVNAFQTNQDWNLPQP